MQELEDVWSAMLAAAGERAEQAGRRHIAEYLRLRSTNDAIRSAGVGWLIDTMVEIAGRELGRLTGLRIESEEPYRFRQGRSQMTGRALHITRGVRSLTVEAGWVRGPSDGIMLRGALAGARLAHFGLPRRSADLRLMRADPLPLWLDGEDLTVDTSYLERHFEIFLQERPG